MNDWDAELVTLIDCRSGYGVPTMAKVEGVQDFDDVDVGFERRPYRRAWSRAVSGAQRRRRRWRADRRPSSGAVGSNELWLAPPRPRAEAAARGHQRELHLSAC